MGLMQNPKFQVEYLGKEAEVEPTQGWRMVYINIDYLLNLQDCLVKSTEGRKSSREVFGVVTSAIYWSVSRLDALDG